MKMDGTRLLVCGSRTWRDKELLEFALDQLHVESPVLTLIHGAARGADTMAGVWAKKHGIEVEVFPADWVQDGKAAGPIRNRRMLIQGCPTGAVAFAIDLVNSRGTADMVLRLGRANIPVMIVLAATECHGCHGHGYISHDPTREPCSDCGGVGRVGSVEYRAGGGQVAEDLNLF